MIKRVGTVNKLISLSAVSKDFSNLEKEILGEEMAIRRMIWLYRDVVALST